MMPTDDPDTFRNDFFIAIGALRATGNEPLQRVALGLHDARHLVEALLELGRKHPTELAALVYRRRQADAEPAPVPTWRPVDIWYPRVAGNPLGVEVSLNDVRAARSIRVGYDFDRDGFVIIAPNNPGDGEHDDDDCTWAEVAFVPAWHEVPE